MTADPGIRRILLVDRGDALERALAGVLSAARVELRRTPSGEEALRWIGSGPRPDLVVSSFHTDDLDGRALFHAFRESRDFRSASPVPLVLFSEPGLRERHGEELLGAGLMGWFADAADPSALVDLVRNWLWLHEALSAGQRLRQEVKRSEIRYRDLLENASDFIFTLDAEGRFVYANNRFKPLTGYDKEEWLGRPFVSLVHGPDRQAALDHYVMAHQGRARVFESRLAHRAAEPTVLSIALTPIMERGDITGTMGIGRDVVEQKRMEKEILDLKNFNESIIESMEAGLMTLDLDGRVASLNTGGQNILGWGAEEAVGRPLHAILPEAEALLRPADPRSRRETELTLRSGRKASIGYTLTDHVDNQRRKVGTIVSFRDISQLKQMQAEVLRMDRLASLGVLASGIAHEIKNPLAGIKSLAQACDEEFEGEDPRREYLARIIRQVNRLDGLLRTFFVFAKPKPPDKKPYPLGDILREVSQLVTKKMEKGGIRFSLDVPGGLPDVWVDAPQIQQVFLNLVLNAIDAMPEGGALDIRARASAGADREPGGQTPAGPFVEVLLADTGVGIPPDSLEAIFNPFYSTKPNGLGLGLSIVHRIVEEHRGDLRVASRPAEGTEFRIFLPTGEVE